ncbi:MAG: hypothetical protein ACJAUL_000322 [Paraglaciecola sp.]|jgi:hypothetical protein
MNISDRRLTLEFFTLIQILQGCMARLVTRKVRVSIPQNKRHIHFITLATGSQSEQSEENYDTCNLGLLYKNQKPKSTVHMSTHE